MGALALAASAGPAAADECSPGVQVRFQRHEPGGVVAEIHSPYRMMLAGEVDRRGGVRQVLADRKDGTRDVLAVWTGDAWQTPSGQRWEDVRAIAFCEDPSAPAGKTAGPPTPPAWHVLEVRYLELVSPAATVIHGAGLEYEVRVHQEGASLTEAEAQARALRIGREGLMVGDGSDRRAVPAHLVQGVRVLSVATASR